METRCFPKVDGGLGLRDLRTLNRVLLKRFSWRILTVESTLHSYLRAHFLRNDGLFQIRYVKPSIWPGLKPLCADVLIESRWLIGRYSKVKFWTDNWLSSLLIDYVDSQVDLSPALDSVVADFIFDSGWSLPTSFVAISPMLSSIIEEVVPLNGPDLLY